MDIIIIGKNGDDLMHTVKNISRDYDWITLFSTPVTNPTAIIDSLKFERPEVVVFDTEAITDLGVLRSSASAVHDYRRMSGKPLTAIYCTNESINKLIKQI